jgi:chromosome segregation ATPase
MGSTQTQPGPDVTAPYLLDIKRLEVALELSKLDLELARTMNARLEEELDCGTCDHCKEHETAIALKEKHKNDSVLSINAQRGKAQQEVESLKQKQQEIENAEADQSSCISDRVAKLQERINELEAEIAELTPQAEEETPTEGSDLEKQLAAERRQLKELEEEMSRQIGEMFGLGEKLDKVEAKKAKLAAALEELELEKSNLEELLASMLQES